MVFDFAIAVPLGELVADVVVKEGDETTSGEVDDNVEEAVVPIEPVNGVVDVGDAEEVSELAVSSTDEGTLDGVLEGAILDGSADDVVSDCGITGARLGVELDKGSGLAIDDGAAARGDGEG